MADLRAQFDEDAVGANHPTEEDVINRLALAEHNNDGTHTGLGAAGSLLATASASASASIDFTSLIDDTFKEYLFLLSNVRPATDGDHFYTRFSVASSFIQSGTEYEYNNSGQTAESPGMISRDNTLSAGFIKIALSVGSAAAEGLSGRMRLYDPGVAGKNHNMQSDLLFWDNQATSMFWGQRCVGSLNGNTGAVDGVRFEFGTGNIASGDFYMYGLRKS